jgi:hypothetical protein
MLFTAENIQVISVQTAYFIPSSGWRFKFSARRYQKTALSSVISSVIFLVYLYLRILEVDAHCPGLRVATGFVTDWLTMAVMKAK